VTTPTDRETLAQRVRRVHTESGLADPREIAEKVFAEIGQDREAIRAALSEALPDFVRITVRVAHGGGIGGPKSSKVDAVRGWYERLMNQPVDISGSNGQWRALRDCTRDDLVSVAQYRREAAARNLQTAEAYERLAKVMKAGVKVGDLSRDLVANTLGRAA
jgi:hypothetical protein